MNLPKQQPLPPPTIIDNRRVYTAGDLREHSRIYGLACFDAGMQSTTGRAENDSRSPAVDNLMGIFGMR